MPTIAAEQSNDLAILLARDLIRTMMLRVRGTEGVVFEIVRDESSERLRTVVHHRPGNSTKEQRDAALKSFQRLVRPCILSKKPAVFEVGGVKQRMRFFRFRRQQYCLVHVVLGSGNEVRALAAVIVRCKNLIEANRCLALMRGTRRDQYD